MHMQVTLVHLFVLFFYMNLYKKVFFNVLIILNNQEKDHLKHYYVSIMFFKMGHCDDLI